MIFVEHHVIKVTLTFAHLDKKNLLTLDVLVKCGKIKLTLESWP